MKILPTLALLTTLGASLSQADDIYHLATEIPLGGEGGWDCLEVDAAAHRLYVSHATKFVVIDTETNTIVGEIADSPGAHDIALVPELSKGFTSNGKENKSSVVDLATLKTLDKVETGKNPDIILYEAGQKEVWCFNAKGNSVIVIDAASAKVVATIDLPGNPEFAKADPTVGKVYVNIEDKSVVAVLDTKTHTIAAIWPIAPGESASGMALDREHHRLFLGCDNKLMVMVDSTNGKVVGSVPITEHIDGTAFDPGTGLAFASGGDGTTTIAKEETPDKLVVVQSLKTEPGARTIAVDPSTHRIYSVAAKTEPEPISSGEHHWPKIIPGTQKVLIYEMGKK